MSRTLVLSDIGLVAIVDFHDTASLWFAQWMGVNHVRMEGHLTAALKKSGLWGADLAVHPAYGGLWRWFTCLARPT